MILTIGKYKGRDTSDIPLAYLKWMHREMDMSILLREAVDQQIELKESGRQSEETEVKKTKHDITDFRPPTHRVAESNITAECYHQLRLIGITPYLEYKFEKCRFNMVIHEDSKILIIIEFRSRSEKYKDKNRLTKQFYKYAQYGIPVLYCKHPSQIPATIEQIVQLLDLHRTTQVEKVR